MNLRQIALEDQPPPKRLFAVLGWGCSGSKWLSRVLNDLPGVFCIHEGRPVWELFGNAKALDAVDYLKMVGLLGSASGAAGDVNSISPYSIGELNNAFGDQFSAIALTRDPFDRLWSELELMRRYNVGSGDSERIEVGARMLNTIVEEASVAPVVRIEDLDGASVLRQTAFLLTDVAPTDAWVERSLKIPPVNHRAPEGHFTPQQRLQIIHTMSALARDLYARLGYHLEEAA